MGSSNVAFDVDDDFYIPEFLWDFWLESCPTDYRNYNPWSAPPLVGLRVYDTYNNVLNTGLNDHPFTKGIFDQIGQDVPALREHPIWETTNSAFRVLEKDAETAIRSLLQQVHSKPRSAHTYGINSGAQVGRHETKLSLGRHSLHSLQKYLIFLRFRNRDVYGKLLGRASAGKLFIHPQNLGSSHHGSSRREREGKADPLSDHVELLKSFSKFFTGGFSGDGESFDFICESIHRRYCNIQEAEICIGLASEPDEYILSASCFGAVEEDGVGNVADSAHYFFPITPRFMIYLLIEAPPIFSNQTVPDKPHFLHRDSLVRPTLDHDVESSVDVYQRNALLLQTLPHYVIFVSARSLIRTITYYNERRWLPENLDYSKLLRGCREECVTYTLLVKASIEVIDLTDDVTLIGECAVSYGTFADVWKGVWTDRQDGQQNIVALKMLRANLVDYVQERLLRRLKKEVKAWHRLEHPHVARLYGIMQLPNTLAMVSPWCENGTIVKYLRETNPGANRLQLLYEIASGVSYLHNCKPAVVHGDLKGCNILIDSAGKAIITDFGLAKVKEEVSDVAELPTSFFAGSTRWMAPELLLAQLEDEGRRPPISPHTDVYAFASVCLEILTGQLPYPHRRNDHAVTLDIMKGIRPSRGSHCLVDVEKTAELWELMDKCWDEFPRSRPNMVRMTECLEQLRHKSFE